ncbi:MAG: thioredoxin domain-containing protein [Polyangiales bacterium]
MSKVAALFLALIIGIAAFAAGRLVSNKSGDAASTASEADNAAGAAEAGDVERYKLPVTDAQPSKGPKDALVTIVEFSEFQCPFCQRVLPTVKQIQDTYGDKVRFVWRNNPLPFHPNASPAANLAMEAFAEGGNEKFWKLHDLLFANQKTLDRANLEKYAQEVGLDAAKVKAALDNKSHDKVIQEDQAIAAQFGARGTPNFFINGRNIAGAQPFENFKAIIDDEIKRAEALVAKGTNKDAVYAAITSNGLTKAAAPTPQERPAEPDAKAVYKVPVAGNEPQRGPDDALVTIVEFSDFECPFCGRVEPPSTALLKNTEKTFAWCG